MEKTIRTLDLHRTSFTKIFDTTNELLIKENPDMIQVRSNIQILEQKMQTLTQLDQKYLDLLLDQDSEDIDLDSEMAVIDEYMCKFSALKMKVEMQVSSSAVELQYKNTPGTSPCCTQNCNKSHLKYPNLEFKKFGGDIRDWLSFWSQFKKYHEDQRLPNEEKLQILIQATIPKSRARQIVESYPPIGDNYPKLIECLTRRFGRQDLQIEVYVRELLKLVLTNVSKSTKLNSLYDQIEAQLRSLETLGVTSDTCSAMLFPLVESCLPEELLKIWERSTCFNDDDSSKVRLDQLMNFLRKEVESEERVALAISGFGDKFRRKEFSRDVPTATGLLTNNTGKLRCIFCSEQHYNTDCSEAKKKSIAELKQILSEKGRCHACLKFGHIASKCRTAAKLKCQTCEGRHVTLMCPKSAKPSNEEVSRSSTEGLCNTLSNATYNEGFLQTLVVNLKGKNTTRPVRVIIDTGSHRSYISSVAAKEMGYEVLRKEELVHALFGGFSTNVTAHNCYRVFLENADKSYSCHFEALDQSVICTNVLGIRNGPWMKELKDLDIKINDKSQAPIEILIGADIAGKLFVGEQHILKCGLVAMKTKLGWTLMGKLTTSQGVQNPCNMIALSLFSTTTKLTDLWTLDVLGIENPEESKSRQEHEQQILDNFKKTVTRKTDGRYEVSMPWIQGHKPISNNLNIAKKRLDNLMNKLDKDGYYDEYDQVFKEWLKEGIIEEVNDIENNVVAHYLPHRHVVKLSSTTTKLRPVFDASAKEKGSPSLNQCVEKGINLLSLIPSLLINFRKSKIGVISDIRKAFLQIELHPSDRDFLRFFWYDKDKNLIVYRHRRVVFGVSSSPFLLNAVIQYHLNSILREQQGDREDTILKLMNSFYVDNCITSLDTEEELQTFIKESTEIFAEAQFDLRMWEFTSSDSMSESKCLSSVLGMNWNRKADTLRLCLENLKQVDTVKITKKLILSVTNRIFDPLGFVSPVLLLSKMLLQKTWIIQLNWDTEVPEDIRETFLTWLNDLSCLSSISIPRWFFVQKPHESQLSIHTFSDASKDAYAAVIFIRCETVAGISLQFVQAKSRVSPTKKITIPRLELLAASIAARLFATVKKALNYQDIPTYFWTDSTAVLSWIKLKENWKPFVWNRIQEIRKLTKTTDWNFVPGTINPADLPSRGCSATQLSQSCWWEGPSWLKEDEKYWPQQSYKTDEETVMEEKKKTVTIMLSQNKIDFTWAYRKFSKYEQIVRLICWIRRFFYNTTNPNSQRKGTTLQLEELREAELSLLKFVQQENFKNDSLEQVHSIIPFKDDNGLIRVKTKITERDDTENFRYPILLPAKHPVVNRLIFDTHRKMLHAGVQTLLNSLRESYWIIGGRKTVKSVISKCGICRRFDSKRMNTPPISLPKNRVKDAAIFEVTGIDLFGPLYLVKQVKIWVAIFTCAIYRAVHLELVTSLSTDSFIAALRRFIARRGRPSTIYSDNQTNFTGCQKALESLDWEELHEFYNLERIEWKFNPPTAAWWGGWWETLIRVIKRTLFKVLQKACLNYEELETVICDSEALINSRPLTYVSEDISDLVPLTPKMFLQDIQQTGVVDLDQVDATHLRRRHQYKNKLKNDLQKRFRNEYLGQLILRQDNRKYNKPIKVGDIVFIENDNEKRLNWPLARVVVTIPGKDDNIRVVKLKTSSGCLFRPIQRLYPLEMNDEDHELLTLSQNNDTEPTTSTKNDEEFQVTRSGRKVNKPKKLNL